MSEFAFAPSDGKTSPPNALSPGTSSGAQGPAGVESTYHEFLARRLQPEMPSPTSPADGEEASLAAPPANQSDSPHMHASGESRAQPQTRGGVPSPNSKDAAASSLERACNALHRTQALLTQLKILGRKAPRVGPALHEAKHAYEQGLSNFRRQCFLFAGECGAASGDLSRAVSLVLARELRSRAVDPPFMPPEEIHGAQSGDPAQAANASLGVPERLSRIQWLFENGTLPSEVIDQARAIALWSGQLFLQARQSLRRGDWEGALVVLEAADAAAISAERICRMCYLNDG